MTTATASESLFYAFHQVCDDATVAKSHYVSLYADVPYYGGPEEGGWWGHDVELVAYRQCHSAEEAQAVKAEVDKMARELTQEACTTFGDYCRRSLEEAEAKGLFAEDLPEVDGAAEYYVTIEDRPGSQVHQGTRHYE